MSSALPTGSLTGVPRPPFDLERVRQDFPILSRQVHGRPLVYLDNGATTQKPQAVLDAERRFYVEENANIHRGVHWLSQKATEDYEAARRHLARFINAGSADEIVFLRGTTEAINLVAQSYGRSHVHAGDEIVITTLEHHSNIVPWQMLCQERGALLRVVPINDAGELMMDEFARLIGPRTRLVAVGHVSNALGTINPLAEIVALAHRQDVPVLVDGAQAVSHLSVDVQALDVDFYAFSGHKLFGPTGVGVLYGKRRWLDSLPPWQGGGDMILSVSFAETVYNKAPFKFEAGTPNIAGGIGLGAAVGYLEGLGLEAVQRWENDLLAYGTEALQTVPGLRIIGTARQKTSILSFVMEDVHPHDIGTVLDRQGVAIRTGHHCAQPVIERFGLAATARASLAFYNTPQEIDSLVEGLHEVHRMFAR